MSKTDDMVVYRMPDGTEVSNDPRFGLEEALEQALDSTENTGDVGVREAEQKAQTQVEHMDQLNSGQPGVGEAAVPDDATENLHGPLGSPAQRLQKEDMAEAAEAGASPNEPSTPMPEPVDSNEAVHEVRKQREERRAAAQQALMEAGEEPGDPDEPYSEWSAKQLKAEVARRNSQDDRAEGDMLVLKGKRRADVAEMLDQDDARGQQTPQA